MRKGFLENLKSSALLRNIATLMTGTLAAQVITVGTTPLLTRLFTPEDFGVLGLLNSATLLFVGVAALRYDMAIVLPKDDDEAVGLLALSLLSTLGTSVVVAAVVAVFGGRVAALFGAPLLVGWLWLAPLIIAVSGAYNALTYWCTRTKAFRRLSVSAILAAGASILGKVAGALAGLGAAGLIGGQILGQSLAALALGAQVVKADGGTIRRAFAWRDVARVARLHIEFPKYQAPLTLLNAASRHVPVYLLGIAFSPHEVGLWTLTVLVMSTPVFLVMNAVRHVIYQRAGELSNSGESTASLFARATLAMLALGLAPTILIVAFGPDLFAWLLGETWREAGGLARYVMVWQYTVLASVPAVGIFPALHFQRPVLIWQIVSLIFSVACLGIGASMGTMTGAVALYCLAAAGMNVLLSLMVGWQTRRNQ